jgi:hypothetical protein
MRTRGLERGFVAIEFVAAVAFLLLPIVVLVATVPIWAERRHAATVAAREAARELVDAWPNANPADAVDIAERVAADHGVGSADVVVRVPSAGGDRGSYVRVEVVVRMPAIAVMGMHAGAWHYTAVALRRVDDYRSR